MLFQNFSFIKLKILLLLCCNLLCFAAHDDTKNTLLLTQSFKQTLPVALGTIGLY